MGSQLKKFVAFFLFNSCLFCVLFIGLQNSSHKRKVDLILDKTVPLPVGFIVGASFISGSIMGSILNINFLKENNLS